MQLDQFGNETPSTRLPYLARMRPLVRRHRRRVFWFGLVGASGVAVNMGLLYGLVGLLGWPTLLGAALATEASIVSNFLLNNWLTFRQAQGQRPFVLRLLRYNGFALGGMLISLLTLALLTYGLHIHYLLANLVATGAAMAWNYIASSRWVWASPSAAQEVV